MDDEDITDIYLNEYNVVVQRKSNNWKNEIVYDSLTVTEINNIIDKMCGNSLDNEIEERLVYFETEKFRVSIVICGNGSRVGIRKYRDK